MFVCLWSSWKSHFWVICRCLTSCLSVRTWEDTPKHSVSFMSFKMSIYCIFQRISWVYMPLCCFQPFSTSSDISNTLQFSGLRRSSEWWCRTSYMIVNICIIGLNVQKNKLLLQGVNAHGSNIFIIMYMIQFWTAGSFSQILFINHLPLIFSSFT